MTRGYNCFIDQMVTGCGDDGCAVYCAYGTEKLPNIVKEK